MGHKIEIDRTKLHPLLNYKLDLALKELEKKKLYIIVTCGYRSFAEQNELYAKGRTELGSVVTNAKGGYSQHNYGIAIDIAMNYDVDKDGKVTDDTWNVKGFKKVAEIMKKHGFGWGGDWKSFKDYPHFYLTQWGDTTTKIRKQYSTYTKFKSTWTTKTTKQTYLRKGRVIDNRVLSVIPKNKTVSVLWRKNKISKVKYDDKYGYVKTANLK